MARIYNTPRIPVRVPKTPKRKVKINIAYNLFLGIMRGLGTVLGISGVAVVLIFVARFIPITEIPFIGPLIQGIINNKGGAGRG